MGEELIRVKNSSFSKYEELLLKRDEVKKAAFHYQQEYVRTFGELILKVFEKKLDCIKKKKTIEFCQTFVNRGKSIDQEALQKYLAIELAEYQKQLDAMVEENENAKGFHEITQVEIAQIKKIYRRLVKRVHPDINPVMDESEELKELWQRLKIAYECNNLKEMQETEVLINAVIKKLNVGDLELEIPDIEEKIAELLKEIEDIKSKDPYQYRYLLDDKEAVEDKKKALADELKEYEEYSAKLEAVLDELMMKGASFTFVIK